MPKTKTLADEANILLEIHLKELGLPFSKEFRFDETRKWRFDYLLVGQGKAWRVAIEIEGGIYTGGRHVRGTGYEKDLAKYRQATAQGFSVYRFSTQEVLNGTAREFIQKHCL